MNELNDKIKSRNKNNSESGMTFRTIADQSLMGIVIIQDDVIKYVNQKFSDLLQYSVEEMMSWGKKEFYKVVGPETIELVKEQSPLKQKGLPGAIEYLTGQLKKKSGVLFWVENFSKTVMYEGRPANYVTIIDITKRVEAEQKLKETKKRFKILFDNSTSGIAYHKIVYDSDGNPIDYIITDVNPQFDKILPYKRGDVIDVKATEAYKVEQAPYLDIYSEVTKIQKSTSFETYFPPIDRHFKISVISTEKGKFITVFDDISERKKAEQKLEESEEKFRTISEESLFGISIIQDDVFKYINQPFLDYTGYTREEIENWKPGDLYEILVHPEQREEVKEISRNNQSGESKLTKHFNLNLIRKNGENMVLDMFAGSIMYQGRAAGMNTSVDITVQRKAEQKLE